MDGLPDAMKYKNRTYIALDFQKLFFTERKSPLLKMCVGQQHVGGLVPVHL
jgi:hypothetical protein